MVPDLGSLESGTLLVLFLDALQFFVLLIEHLLIEDTVWIIRALLAE